MEELFKHVFDSLPHVNVLWVDNNGDYYLHPKKGCEVVRRPTVNGKEVIPTEEKKPKKKK